MKRLIAVLGLAVTVFFGLALLSTDAQAFQNPWYYSSTSVNVPMSDTRFYDDVPVGVPVTNIPNGIGWEAGLLMFSNNQNLNETLYVFANVNIPSTSQYKTLEVRAAGSDGSFFRVGYGFSATGTCTVWPSALLWPTVTTPYLTRYFPVTIPTGQAVRKVCLLLSDYPDTLAVGWSKALIDYIRFRNTSGATGWIENFYGSP